MNRERDKLRIMVSSTVYGIEELLDRVYTLLTSFGYEVWMSHKGTVPVFSNRTAFGNCLQAVKDCDLFLGIITPNYGSGQDPKDSSSLSITHQEILKAIELNNLGGCWLTIMWYLPVHYLTIWGIKVGLDELI